MFTDSELRAYLNEELPITRTVAVEAELRSSPSLMKRLEALLADEQRSDLSLERIWRDRRLSCPARSTWALYVAGGLGDGLTRYLDFHLEATGCRFCQANLDDLRSTYDEAASQRTRRVFETSIGRLHSASRPAGPPPDSISG